MVVLRVAVVGQMSRSVETAFILEHMAVVSGMPEST